MDAEINTVTTEITMKFGTDKPADPPLSRSEYVRHFERLLESAEGWTDDGYTITHASGARLWVWQGRFRLCPVANLGGDELDNLPGFGFWGRRKLWPKVEAVRRAVACRAKGGA